MTRVIYDLVQEIIAETTITLAVAVDQGHRQPTVDIMAPTLCLSTLCIMGSQTDRQQRTRRQQVRKANQIRRCRATSALQRTRDPRVAIVLKLLNEKVWRSYCSSSLTYCRNSNRSVSDNQPNGGTAGLTTTTSSCRRFFASTSSPRGRRTFYAY